MMKSYLNNRFSAANGALALPPVDFTHLRTMTDDTGILQHATYSIPNREHGYCVDDNARALIVACDGWRMGCNDDLRDLVAVYLSFVIHAFSRESGRFRNFMSYDRQWLELEAGSEDSHGRTMWGLGVAATSAPLAPQRELGALLLERGLPVVSSFYSPRAIAFTIMGLDRFLDHEPRNVMAMEGMALLAGRLQSRFADNSAEDWPWLEDTVTYANAVLPLALIAAGERLDDEAMITTALTALDWLIEVQTAPEGHLSIIGNEGWMQRGGSRAQYDQQPLDAAAIVLACVRAAGLTGAEHWNDCAMRAIAWFLGRNDLRVPLYDEHTGGCRDGLAAHGANSNQGAESTVEWLLARLAIESLPHNNIAVPERGGMISPNNGWHDGGVLRSGTL